MPILVERLRPFNGQLRRLEDAIADAVQSTVPGRCLLTIPKMGPVTAGAFRNRPGIEKDGVGRLMDQIGR